MEEQQGKPRTGKGRPYQINVRPRPRKLAPIAIRLSIGLLLLVAGGALVLLIPGVAVNDSLEAHEAIFTAVSALTVTGLSIITPVSDLTWFGQVVLLVLIQIGGIGYMVVVVIALRLIGRKIYWADQIALTDSLGLVSPRAILQITTRALRVVFGIQAVGAVLLWLNWRSELGETRAIFYGIFHAVSSFCNAGFDLFNGLPGYPTGIPKDAITLTVMCSLIFLGGLGIPVLLEIIDWRPGKRPSMHGKLTIVIAFVLLLIGWVGLFVAEIQPDGNLDGLPIVDQLGQSLAQSVSTRTAGFAFLTRFEALHPASQALMMLLMFIGCAPASMGGGITTGTFIVLLFGIRSVIQGNEQIVVGGKALTIETLRRATAVLGVSLITVMFASWLILITHDVTLDMAVFEVISAFATCGLTLNMTAQLNPIGLVIIMVMMFWGRLGAITLLIALIQRKHSSAIRYAETQILIA